MSRPKNSSQRENDDFLKFTTAQKRGIFVLVGILICILVITIFHIYLPSQTSTINSQEFEKQVAEYETTLLEEQQKTKESFDFKTVDYSFAEAKLHPFPFNPNTLTTGEWKNLGLSDKQIKVIQNYLSKGGKFYKKEDFKKMYCISDKEYALLAPYITIEQAPSKNQEQLSAGSGYKKPAFIVDLNHGDSLDFQELKGIGSAFSSRMVKYRTRLGGFYDKSQLLEVYGFTQEMLSKIENSITIDTKSLQKINLNKADINDLKKHPYLDYYMSKAIVKYREKAGKFSTVDELLFVNLIDETTFLKIKPYLVVE